MQPMRKMHMGLSLCTDYCAVSCGDIKVSNSVPPMCAEGPRVVGETRYTHQKKQQPAQTVCDLSQMSFLNCQLSRNMNMGVG